MSEGAPQRSFASGTAWRLLCRWATPSAAELSDRLVAVTESAGNSLVHGGGAGTLRVWATDTGVVCEVRDRRPLI